jgi:hypothetical protein
MRQVLLLLSVTVLALITVPSAAGDPAEDE